MANEFDESPAHAMRESPAHARTGEKEPPPTLFWLEVIPAIAEHATPAKQTIQAEITDPITYPPVEAVYQPPTLALEMIAGSSAWQSVWNSTTQGHPTAARSNNGFPPTPPGWASVPSPGDYASAWGSYPTAAGEWTNATNGSLLTNIETLVNTAFFEVGYPGLNKSPLIKSPPLPTLAGPRFPGLGQSSFFFYSASTDPYRTEEGVTGNQTYDLWRNLTLVQHGRFKLNKRSRGFIAKAQIHIAYELLDSGFAFTGFGYHDTSSPNKTPVGFTIRYPQIVTNGATVSPNTWTPVPMPDPADLPGSLDGTGCVGLIVWQIYGETTTAWSARTGLAWT